MDHEDLRQVACEYVAGDLATDEAAAFESLLAGSTDLQREVAFWQSMGSALREHGRPEAHVPGDGLAEVVHRRVSQSRHASAAVRSDPRAWPRWLPGISAALAAGILLVFGLDLLNRNARPHPVAWGDDGTVVMVPAAGGNADGVMPLHAVNRLEPTLTASAYQPQQRCWAGVWTTPVSLAGFDHGYRAGVQVVRVVDGGPADRHGVVPGDVIVAIDGASVREPRELARAIARRQPGDRCRLTVFHPDQGSVADHELRLGAIIE